MDKVFYLVPKRFPIDEPTWIDVSDNKWKQIASNAGRVFDNLYTFYSAFNRGELSEYYLRILTP